MKEKGYIKVARKSIESDIWLKPPLYWKIWCYILFKVNYENSGNIEKGERFFTIEELQKAGTYYVGYRKEVPSVKQIRTIINYLRNPYEGTNEGRMIDTTKVTHGMLIKVLNYSVYQSSEYYEGNNESHTKGARKEKEGHNIKKNIKNNNKEINIYSQLVLDYLNKQTGKAFKYSETSLKPIRARLNEGYTIEECKSVIDKKSREWKNDNRMNQYLRPSTLFASDKFESYLNQKETGKVLPSYFEKTKEEIPLTKEEQEMFIKMIGEN